MQHPLFPLVPTCALSLLLAVALTGCGLTDSQAYKSTRRLYYTYLNRPASLELSDAEEIQESSGRMARMVMPVDAQLSSLERMLDSLKTPPDQQAMESIMHRYPWLSSLVLTDGQGYPMASFPTVPLKQLDFTPLTEAPAKSFMRDLRGAVQETPLGPEVMLARPFLDSSELRAMLVATFDVRSLLTYVSAENALMVYSPTVLLWAGDQDPNQGALNGVDWANLLRRRSEGALKNAQQSLIWTSRYVGGVPLVFVTPDK